MSGLPETEGINARTTGMDLLDAPALVELLIAEQRSVADAVAAAAGEIARAAETIAAAIRAGGRAQYIGAGTSGRLAVLDASEMPPTFGVARDCFCAHIAGGDAALRHAIEGAEDDAAAGAALVDECAAAGDVVVGISAGGGAPFVVAAIRRARDAGIPTIAVVNAEGTALAAAAENTIVLATGAEPIAGSTRMRAGTAQKIALNTLSTAVMVLLGKTYDNMMVDLVATNAKLRRRAAALVQRLSGVDATAAQDLLKEADGSVKTAVVMHARGVSAEEARALLSAENGFLRPLL